MTNEQIIELRKKREQGTQVKGLMVEYSLSKATIYRHLSEKETEHNSRIPILNLPPYFASIRR